MNSIELIDLEFYNKIGQGSFGKVWEGSYLGTPVAIKECLPTEDENDFDFLKYFEREADLLSKSRHPNIVQFLGTCVHNNKFYIVTEHISCGTMKSWIISGKVSNIKTRLSFAIDVARALTYLHSRNIIHRDLKPSNLLITENKRIKVCDFGFARLIARSEDERRRMTYCGTDEYMAPELLQGQVFDESADVFGFGIILCELISLKVAGLRFFKREAPEYKISLSEIEERATKDCPKHLVSLAIRCVSHVPKERPTMREVLQNLHVIEKISEPFTSVQIGAYSEETKSPKFLPVSLNDIIIPDNGLSIPGLDSENNIYTPNLICDSSIHSSELSPYSNYSNSRLKYTNAPSKIDDFSQRISVRNPESIKDFSQAVSEISVLNKYPFQNFFIGEASITLSQTALPQIDDSHGTANFSFQTLSKLNHEGLGFEKVNKVSSDTNSGYGHRFSIQLVDGAETCKLCQQRLSDFLTSTYGMVCDDCEFLCHKRCSSLAPFNCDAPSPALRALASLFVQPSYIEKDTSCS